MIDAIAAARTVLLEDPMVGSMTEGRVYAGELARGEVASMPRKNIVITYAGGGRRAGTTPIAEIRLRVWSYAESFHEAGRLDAAVFDALEAVIRRVVGAVLIHAASPDGAPEAVRDAETGWPAYVRPARIIVDQREVEG